MTEPRKPCPKCGGMPGHDPLLPDWVHRDGAWQCYWCGERYLTNSRGTITMRIGGLE